MQIGRNYRRGRFGQSRLPPKGGGSGSRKSRPRHRGALIGPELRDGNQSEKKATALAMAKRTATIDERLDTAAEPIASNRAAPRRSNPGVSDRVARSVTEAKRSRALSGAPWCFTVAWKVSIGRCRDSDRSRISRISRSTRLDRSFWSLAFITGHS